MKRILAICIVISIALSVSLGAIDGFQDLEKNWSYDAVKWAVANGILKGTDGKINPKDNATRAEVAAMLVRILGGSNKTDISNFQDVNPNAWYYDEFSQAVTMKLFKGYDGKIGRAHV